MLRRIDLRGTPRDAIPELPRVRTDVGAVRARVADILAEVAAGGDTAVRALTARFDGVEVDDLAVPDEVRRRAREGLAEELVRAVEQAAAQVRWFHEQARPRDWSAHRDGARVGQWFRPVERVGVYVPGGKAAYPSTVIMTVVPARVAGVSEIVLCSPPRADGWPDPAVLGVAELLGVDRVFRVGGAQAIAAMAYGTATVPRCELVVGPGNVYVAAAKQLLAAEGRCGIDTVAGPTEVAIIADDTADAGLIAADLVAQAEHDEDAACLLITPSAALADRVDAALVAEVEATRHRDRVRAALAGQGAAVLVDDLDHAVVVAERYAPEHLEVHTRDAETVAARVRYAGTTFIGADTPVALGDYAAGPNHTLPTGGRARFAGGLSTHSFLVPVNWVAYDRAALAGLAPTVRALAAAEDLPAHARAVEVRLR